MGDMVDQAQRQADDNLADALARVAIAPRGHGSLVCRRCHGDVPKRRAELGYYVCLDCQSAIERKGGR
jgi:hypothetical protein